MLRAQVLLATASDVVQKRLLVMNSLLSWLPVVIWWLTADHALQNRRFDPLTGASYNTADSPATDSAVAARLVHR